MGSNRRQEVRHVAVGALTPGTHAADVVVDLVVRLSFQHGELGARARHGGVRRRLGAGETQRHVGVIELLRLQSAGDLRRRAGIHRLGVELRVVAGEIARPVGRGEALVAGNELPGLGIEAGDIVPQQLEAGIAAAVLLLALLGVQLVPVALHRRLDVGGEGVEVLGVGRVRRVGRRQHAVEHLGGDLRQLRPIPVGKGEVGIAAQRADRLLDEAHIASVPDIEPPVAVRAVHEMGKGGADPVARIVRRQLEHLLDALGVALEHLLALGAGHIVALVLRRRPRGRERQRRGANDSRSRYKEFSPCEAHGLSLSYAERLLRSFSRSGGQINDP